MKKIINLSIATLLFFACSTNKKELVDLKIENKTGDTLKAELFNIWSGKTDTLIGLPPGETDLFLKQQKIAGFYVNGYPEKTILFWKKAKLIFTPEKIVLDSVNRALADHQLWSQQIATGETTDLFKWPDFAIDKEEQISQWQELDNILHSLFNTSGYSIKKNKLKKEAFSTYPSAYMLLHKYADTTGIWIKNHIEHVTDKLNKAGVQSEIQNAFLAHYLQPKKPSLRNDSAIIVLKTLKPKLAEKLSVINAQLKKNSKVKAGEPLPDITGTSVEGKKTHLTTDTKWTIVDFWATWCIPCIKQLPELNKLAQEHGKTIKIVSISVDNKRDYDKWLKQARSTKYIEHIWVSDTTNIRTELNIRGLPRMILLDKEGKVKDANFPHLSNPLSRLWLKELVKPEKLADKKP